jgi:cytidylate kinase
VRAKAIIAGQRARQSEPGRGQQGPIITIDGPAGVGKSTVAERLASRLGYLHLDTGALYRAVAWKVRASAVSPTDEQAVVKLLPMTRVTMEQRDKGLRVLVDGHDVTQAIRTPEITEISSVISAIPAVREWLLPVQRSVGGCRGVVAEGRDLGTRVFPTADVKFFLEADADIRAARRHGQLQAAGHTAALNETQQEIHVRDRRDRGRVVAPLVPAVDAQLIDTSTLAVDEVIEQMMAVIATRL